MKRKFVSSIVVLLIAVVCAIGCLSLTRAQEAYAVSETVYIDSEADFLSFISTCKGDATKLQSETKGKRYVLRTDIYLTRYIDVNGINDVELFFHGEFDGNGHAIVGYKGSRAFFARLTPDATVKNLSFIGAELTAGKEDGIVATENLGTISGITVTGKAVGNAVAGICAYNYGTIKDSVVMVELVNQDGSTPEYASAIALSNTADAFKRIKDDYSSYVGAYSITNTRHPSSDGYTAVLEKDKEYTEPEEDLIADKKIETYTELLWYLHSYAYASKNFSELPVAYQKCYINLYNLDLGTLGDVLQSALDNKKLTVNHCGYYNATAVLGDNLIGSYLSANGDTVPTASETLEGSGTSTDPYLIYNVSDFVALNGISDYCYVTLKADIDFNTVADSFYKPSSGTSFIPSFNGVFDGNGHSVSGIVNSTLFGNISATSVIKNLTVIGKSGVALVGNTLLGTAQNITAYGTSPYAFLSVSGTISRCDISLGGAVAKELKEGALITYTRNAGEAFVVTSPNVDAKKITVKNSQNVSATQTSTFNVTAVNSVSYTSTGEPEYTSDVNSYTLVSVSSTGTSHTVADGWKFGQETSWGFIKDGSSADTPVLVFPYDNISYKKLSVFANATDTSGVYGAISNSYTFTVSATTDNAVSKEYVENLIIEGDDTFEGAFLDGLPLSVRKALTSDNVSISWIQSNGTAHTAGSFDYGKGDREIELYLETSYYYIGGKLTVDENNTCTISYNTVRYGVDSAYLVGKFGFDGFKAVFADVYGLTLNENYSHAIDFDGITIEYFKDGQAYLGAFVTTPGEYTMRVTLAPTIDCTGAVFQGKYTVTKGTAELDDYDVSSSLGGLTEEDAPTYNTNVLNPTFSLAGLRRAGASYAYQITSFARTVGGDSEVAYRISEAGVYTLELTVNLPGYNPYTRSFDFYVGRKQAVVTPVVESLQIAYGSAHPKVSYTSPTLNDFNGISYTTTYTRFSAPGSYSVSLSYDAQKINPNYIIVNGKDATFNVVQAEIDYSSAGFVSTVTTYDGTAHSAILDIQALKTLNSDTQKYTYTVTYAYGEYVSDTPFAFTNVGEYKGLSVTVTPEPQNYKPFTIGGVSIKITPLELKIKANECYVNYNAEAVYSVTIVRADGGSELTETYENNITPGTDYTITSSYQKGYTPAGAVLNVIVEIKNEYVGNYRLVGSENSTLTVGKRRYSLNVKTEYAYTGFPVVLDYNGEVITEFEEGYPKYYKVRGGVETELEGAPQNVNDSTCIYRAKIVTKETSEYYSCSKTVDFSITPITVNAGNLLLYGGSSPVTYSGNEVYYNRTGYRIDIDKSSLPAGASFVWTYSYEVYDQKTDTWSTEVAYNEAPSFTLPTKVKNYTVTATDNNGNYNNLYIESGDAVLVISPKNLVFEEPQELTYKGKDGYTDEDISAIIGNLDFSVDSSPVFGDAVAYDIECPQKIVTPGSYTVKIISDTTAYTIEDVIVKIVCASVEIDIQSLPTFVYEYGTLFNSNAGLPSITYNIHNASIGAVNETVTLRVGCSKHQTSYIAPGTYSIVSADPFVTDGTECVKFTIVGGEQKVTVYPKTVTFDRYNISGTTAKDGILDQYVYGEIGTIYNRVHRLKVSGALGNDDPEVTITPNEPVNHAGTYTFTAEAKMEIPGEEFDEYGDPVNVRCYCVKEDIATFVTTVTPKQITYSIEACTVYAEQEIPSEFTATYSGADGATESFTVPDYIKGVSGSFSVVLTLYNVENGIRYNDYTTIKQDASAKELTITLREFSADLVAIDTNVTYSGNAVNVIVEGLPEGAEVSQSLYPVNVGEYSVEVTVTKDGYQSKTLDASIVISKATPFITQDEATMEYTSGYIFTDKDPVPNARAEFNESVVSGRFRFTQSYPRQSLNYGTYTYKIDFIPDDTLNFKSVKNASYTITSYINKEEVSFDLGDISTGDLLSGVGEVGIGSIIPEKYSGAVCLYVNGELVGEDYTFTESEEGVLLELRIGAEVLYSQTVNIKITTGNTVVRPTDPNGSGVTPSAPDTKFEIVDEDKMRTWIIVGAVAGGAVVVGGVIGVVIVVLKRKGKLGGK